MTSIAGTAQRGYAVGYLSDDGLNEIHSTLSSRLRIRTRKAHGFVEIHSAGKVRRIPLQGLLTVDGDVRVKLGAKSIEITGLPARTTAVTLNLRRGTVSGSGHMTTTALVGPEGKTETKGAFRRLA